MKLQAKALIILVILCMGDLVQHTRAQSGCQIAETKLDFDQLKLCIGQYPSHFQTYIVKMASAHTALKTSTSFYLKARMEVLKKVSISLIKVSRPWAPLTPRNSPR
jgi:hypothetical protein